MQKDLPIQVTAELTEREREILGLLATGASNKDIARQLFISSNTVKVHLRNIFAKIGVASRTEAAMYALREGLSHAVDGTAVVPVAEELPAVILVPLKKKRKPLFLWIVALGTVLLIGFATFFIITVYQPPVIVATNPAPPTPQRWQEQAALPTARSGLAVASRENQIYAIGGETKAGVTNLVERYDLPSNAWTGLSSKPTAVTDISAAVVGGRIYVPGGRLASGKVTDILEVYDPRDERWEQAAALPVALSAYALVAFEGKLYLFGGWDGERFLDSVYEYNADGDTWRTRAPMPTARAYAGAAAAGGGIYVLGGYNGKQVLAVNEEYLPERDSWSRRAPLPAGRYAIGAASIADMIYVIGGEGETDSAPLPPLQYLHQQDKWQAFENPFQQQWSHLGLVPLQTQLYGVGGRWNGIPTAQNLSYQAIYTIMIPIVP